MTDEHFRLIKNIRLIDAQKKKTDGCDLLFSVKQGKSKILEIGKNLKLPDIDGATLINAHGKILCPAFTDLRCVIPDPGYVGRESMKSGLSAAAAGGYARVLLSPATKPMADHPALVNSLLQNSLSVANCRALIAAPLTKGGKGEELCDFAALKNAGISALSAAGEENEASSYHLLKALAFCKEQRILFIAPVGEKSLDQQGIVNKGKLSRLYKNEGIDPLSECIALSSAILLAKHVNAPVFFPLVTLKESVEMAKKAKKEGVKLFCATPPQYFSFAEEEVLLTGNNAKLLPPLRSENDRLAVIAGLREGVIDCICSDHTPHTDGEKRGSFEKAAYGAIGFETAFAAGVTHLVLPGYLSLYRLIELMALTPASLLGYDASLKPGGTCDFCFIDPDAEMVYGRSTLRSRSANTPFFGRALKGRVTGLYIDGVKQF